MLSLEKSVIIADVAADGLSLEKLLFMDRDTTQLKKQKKTGTIPCLLPCPA